MKVEIICQTKLSSPLKPFLREAVCFFEIALEKKKILKPSPQKKLTLAFISSKEIKKLNKQFLNQNDVTDVLSFSPVEKNSLGELALCMKKIKSQAKKHKNNLKEETAYLILHGLLHLLGFHHEKGGATARQMYQIQDDIFNQWRKNLKKS